MPVNPHLGGAQWEPPHTPNTAELHVNGLKPLLTPATTLRVTHPSLSLKAPGAAQMLFSTLKHCVAHISHLHSQPEQEGMSSGELCGP